MLEQQIDSIFQEYGEHTPGCSVLVYQNGNTVYRKAFGMANIENQIPNTPETIYHVASVSKQFTAFSILLLTEDGKLSLDDSIHKYLPELPDFGYAITVRHLLHHTSGLREQWDLFTLSGHTMEDVATSEHIMRLMQEQQELNFIPGSRFLYCNSGYTILAQIVRKVSGKTLREFAKERIFEPLKMENTFFKDDHTEIIANRASSYGYNPEREQYTKLALSFDITGSTSLNTTVDDLMKWLDNLCQPVICRQAVIDQLLQKFKLSNGDIIDYCCGIRNHSYHGVKVYEHSGANAGYRSAVVTMPELKLSIIVLSNYRFSFPMQKAFRLAELVSGGMLGEKGKGSSKAESPAKMALNKGLYVTSDFRKAFIEKVGDDISFRQDDMLWSFKHIHGNKYYCQNGNSLELCVDGTIQFCSEPSLSKYRQVECLTVEERTAKDYGGTYYSPELLTMYSLLIEDNQLILENPASGKIRFSKIGENSYLAINRETLNLVLDKSNGKYCFLLNTDRTKKLTFYRIELLRV